ncbi:MAG: DUF4388 domain-containing protein, partial [Mycobacteriales bacterium]
MLRGDLTASSLAEVLHTCAQDGVTGCLKIRGNAPDEALVYFRDGSIYAASAPGPRPLLGVRLVSSNALAPEALEEALEAQKTELSGWRLGELLVHLGYVAEDVVVAFVAEQVRDVITELLTWQTGSWRFRRGEKTREAAHTPVAVDALLGIAAVRRAEWESLLGVVHDRAAIPCLASAGGTGSHATLDADAWALLCKIDGTRTLAELSVECGFTALEGARVVGQLVEAGLVEVEPPPSENGDPSWSGPAADIKSAAPVASAPPLDPPTAQPPATPPLVHAAHQVRDAGGDDDVELSLARVSQALADVMGPQSYEQAPQRLMRTPGASVRKPRPATDDPELARRERIRHAAASELAAAHAEAEAIRRGGATALSLPSPDLDAQTLTDLIQLSPPVDEGDEVAEVVSLDRARRGAHRRSANRSEQATAAEEAEAARMAEEAEAARVAAEEAEAARMAEEA